VTAPATAPTTAPETAGLGYEPALDGLRAISVLAVVLYHAGVDGIHGGFFGVEVFFVVSGFLITALLIEERAQTGGTSLRRFWIRRARRLLPALAAVLLAVTSWTVLVGNAEQLSQLRRDLPWAVLYGANWGQILGDVPYFAAVDPPMLRHLWSLAVEEQWYLLWPLAFLAVSWLGLRSRTAGMVLAAAAAVVNGLVWVVARGGDRPLAGPLWLEGSDRINVMYLSTPSRSSGLLLGAALAFGWRAHRHRATSARRRWLDVAGAVALCVLGVLFAVGRVTSPVTYPWTMAAVTVASGVAVVLTVHPGAHWFRRLLGWSPIAGLGRRSYGIYLWHWPVFVAVGATDGRWSPILLGVAVTAVLSELCFRFLETPIRRGALGHLWRDRPRRLLVPATGLAAVTAVLVVAVVSGDEFDRAVGGEAVAFELATPVGVESADSAASTTPSATTPSATAPGSVAAAAPTAVAEVPVADRPATSASSSPALVTEPVTPATLPTLPRSVTVVGDSQAHSLAVNLPSGIEPYFAISDGSVDGCSVHDRGRVVSELNGFSNDFERCASWATRWAQAAAGSELALVMLGAWDVFDLEVDGELIRFGSRAFDELFLANLQIGIDSLAYVGTHAALLEIGCMRPVEARGQGVPPLPERGRDWRVAHVNGLLRRGASANPGRASFIEGPEAWCRNEAIATDRDYRWDGVHVYSRGAALILETVAPALLAIQV
jgi:peptidoglycan/LPS O-acetylase OafA/YrhL